MRAKWAEGDVGNAGRGFFRRANCSLNYSPSLIRKSELVPSQLILTSEWESLVKRKVKQGSFERNRIRHGGVLRLSRAVS